MPSLARWGRSPGADLVYRALLTCGPRTGRELSRDLGMSSGRILDVLAELLMVNAVVAGRVAGRSAPVWRARPAAEVLPALSSRVRSGAGHRRRPDRAGAGGAISAAGAVCDPLTLGDGVRHLPSRALTRERLAELNAAARTEHLSMHPEESFDPASARAALPMDRMLIERGVRMRVLGVQSPASDSLRPYGREPTEARPEYRHALAVPMKLIVVDRRVALFPVDPVDLERGYLEITQPAVVSALAATFERQWASATDVRRDAMPEITLDQRERAVVVLLAQGHTDATVAVELGLSPRSVSTVLRRLMDRLEVDNRFQLGLALGALRVLPGPSKKDDIPGGT
ncbi:helix-turn-helix transcriptional regulator [Plantactinospora sp. B6F1]|uniref:helix-turn-helix transcriptional regulator n=1 Tax=Plantactinospora sp. B6F1 TaxID=3158971 RepID=UPI0032D9972A